MQQKSIVAVLVALVVVLAGMTIYFAVSNNAYAPSASQPLPAQSLAGKIPATTTQTATNNKNIATVDTTSSYDTISWKVYTNTKYGYSFKYPQNKWLVYGDIDDVKNAAIASISLVNAQDRSHLVEVSSESLQSKINEAVEMYSTAPGYKKSDVTFLGMDATQIIYSTIIEGEKESGGKAIIFSKGGSTYYLDGNVRDYEKAYGVDVGIFNAILSTFKFTK